MTLTRWMIMGLWVCVVFVMVPAAPHADMGHDQNEREEPAAQLPQTRAQALACREQLMAAPHEMPAHKANACVELVSHFRGLQKGSTITIRMITDEQGRTRYLPERVEIDRGDTIQWVVESGAHNTAAYPNRIPKGTEPWEAPMMSQPGESYYRTFFFPGTYQYHCHPHEQLGMRGSIIVERESQPHDFREVMEGEGQHAHQH